MAQKPSDNLLCQLLGFEQEIENNEFAEYSEINENLNIEDLQSIKNMQNQSMKTIKS